MIANFNSPITTNSTSWTVATFVGGKFSHHYTIPCSNTFHSWGEGKWPTNRFPATFRRSYTRQTATKILRQQCWNEVLTIRNNVAALWCTENRCHDLLRDGEEEETNNAARAIAPSGTFLSRPQCNYDVKFPTKWRLIEGVNDDCTHC